MKRSWLLALFLSALANVAASAQTNQAHADIPFDFHVGKSALHAGEYDIRQNGSLLRVYSPSKKVSVFHLTTPASRTKVTKTGLITFMRLGGEYYMTNLWVGESLEGASLLQTKQEKELVRSSLIAKTTTVPLKSRSTK